MRGGEMKENIGRRKRRNEKSLRLRMKLE